MSPTLILFTLCLPAFTAIIVWGANHHFLGPQQVNQRGGECAAVTHLQAQVFILLLRKQAEDDTGGGTCPKPHLDSCLARRQRPQELELNVTPAVEGELWSRLSIKKKQKACSINSAVAWEIREDIAARNVPFCKRHFM